MTTASLLTIIAMSAFVVVSAGLAIWRHYHRDEPAAPLTVPGLAGRVAYNCERIDRTTATEIAFELLRVKMALWPEYLRIYGTGLEYGLNVIIIDPAWYDKRHGAGMKLSPSDRVLTFNPTVKWQYGDYRNAFGAELHNLIRYQLFGRDYVTQPIDPEDADRMWIAMRMWKAL